MNAIELLVQQYLTAEQALTSAIDEAGGSVTLGDGRTVITGRAEYDVSPGARPKRAWVIVRKNAPIPPRR